MRTPSTSSRRAAVSGRPPTSPIRARRGGALTDTVLSTSGGGAALGKNSQTIYLGTGDPFDPGVGGYAYKSIDGGETWSAGIKLGASTVIPDVKVDTSGPADVILMGTNAGLFRSTDGGATYTPVLGGLIWSLQRTSAGWLAARTVGANGSIAVLDESGSDLGADSQRRRRLQRCGAHDARRGARRATASCMRLPRTPAARHRGICSDPLTAA